MAEEKFQCIATGETLPASQLVKITTMRLPTSEPIVVVDKNNTMTSPACYLTAEVSLLEKVFADKLIEQALQLNRDLTEKEQAHVTKMIGG